MKKTFYILYIFLGGCHFVSCQEINHYKHYSAWTSIMPKIKLNNKIKIKTEFHFRRTNFLEKWEQNILRPSISYKLNNALDLSLGYSLIKNYNFSNFSIPIDALEQNIWQQLLMKHNENKLVFNHRFRLEERFIDKIIPKELNSYEINGNEFKNRFRYRITAKYPILEISRERVINLKFFDELFVNLNEAFWPKSFNQNWIYLGLTLPIDNTIVIDFGYHHVGLKSKNNFISNEIIASGVSISI